MYRIYYTTPGSVSAHAIDMTSLTVSLKVAEDLRRDGMLFVSMVSDYHNMVGKPGASGTDHSYVPQMLN